MAQYPGALPTFAGFTASNTLATDNHAAQHNLEQAEVVQVATKVGTGSSTSTSGTVLTGTGTGTSSWAQCNLTTMVTGTLPVANGGTGVTTSTGTGKVVLDTSPTLTTPIISAISNTGTLTLPTSTDTLVGRDTTDTLTNKTLTSPVINGTVTGDRPYFTAKLTTGTYAAVSVLVWDSEVVDNTSSYNNTTGRFTAPTTGYYVFGFNILLPNANAGEFRVGFYLNGGIYDESILVKAASTWQTIQGTCTSYMTATHYMEVKYSGGGGNIYTDYNYNQFWGFKIM